MLNIDNRLEYNLKLLGKIEEACRKNPDMRFLQALYALDILEIEDYPTMRIKDGFYEEPWITYLRIKK